MHKVGRNTEATFDREIQDLPIPIAGLTPAHRQTRPLRRLWRRWQPVCLTSVGLIAAAIGVVVALGPVTIDAYGDGATIHIGSSVLERAESLAMPGARLYLGDASIVMVPDQRGWRAAAAATLGGKVARGLCRLEDTIQGATETCTFTLGEQTLSATDTFDASSGQWRREYTDGVRVMFSVPPRGGRVPIPLPLGHS